MAFGDDPFGAVPIGTPPPGSTDRTVNTRPVGLFFDGATRDYPLDEETGRYVETDQATAACQARLFNLRGRIRSSPTTGTTLDKRSPFGPRAQAEVDSDVKTALDPVVRRGWISNVRVRMQPISSGGMKVEVVVLNHLTGRDQPIEVT